VANISSDTSRNTPLRSLLKVVYFDEDSASDYLDIATGGREATSSEKVKTRSTTMRASVLAELKAKFNWLPGLFGASAKLQGGFDISSAGQSVLRKTISNTILTDYLARVEGDSRIKRLDGIDVVAPPESMAFLKMYTPYMTITRTEQSGIDLAKLDEAFVAAKGYYELVGSTAGVDDSILRFNFGSFRNNYRLTDLPQMRLIYHGVKVGDARADQLGLDAAMISQPDLMPSAQEVLLGTESPARGTLPVYDILLAGVEQDE
jgi:Family of unknown function (DUF6414)